MAELFENFEVNRDPRWQVLSKLVGASLVLHLGFCGWLFTFPLCATPQHRRTDRQHQVCR